MTRRSGFLSRAVLSALGADPHVFFPAARIHGLLVRRRAGLVHRRSQQAFLNMSPFLLLCLFAFLYGAFSLMLAAQVKLRILGQGLAVAVGCVFLLIVVVTDHLDTLVNPREQLVLGAHPHDDRSILLAKLWVIGRSLAILFGLFILLPLVGVLIDEGLLDAVAFLAGATAAAIAASIAGLYLGVAVLTIFGRKGFQRIMPWLQIAFQFSYFLFLGGRQLLRTMRLDTLSPGLAWGFPPLWYLAPLEAVQEGGLTASTAGRTLLALGVFAALLVGGTRWLGSRVGDRLLEPIERHRSRSSSRSRTVSGQAGRGLSRLFGFSEKRRLFELLLVHVRSDWKIRSEFLMGPVICALLLATSMHQFGPWTALGFTGWFLFVSMDLLTRSPRPELLWFLLVSPMDRTRFSRSAVALMRIFQLAPLVLIFAVFNWKASGPDFVARLLFLALVVAYGDLIVLAGRVFFPEFPFSRTSRADSQIGGGRIALLLGGGLVTSVATACLYLLGLLGRGGFLTGIGLLLLAHIPVAAWMRRRVAFAAETFEPEAGSVA